jgi:hypothetical protein
MLFLANLYDVQCATYNIHCTVNMLILRSLKMKTKINIFGLNEALVTMYRYLSYRIKFPSTKCLTNFQKNSSCSNNVQKVDSA